MTLIWKHDRVLYAGIIWTVVFAGMSFYWAAGGMIGVESLGGVIYEKALVRDTSFIPVVWATGFAKLAGALLLSLLMLRPCPVPYKWKIWVRMICVAAGIFMFLYGVGNMITISLAERLGFELSDYARRWRLVFWEPYWIVGGILYTWAGWRKK